MIRVVVPLYNCLPWIARCLYSIYVQEGCEFRVVVADDASTDGTSDIASKLSISYGFQYHRNDENIKCPANLVETIDSSLGHTFIDDEEIIYIVDGDDCLTHPRSLKLVQDAYDADPELWLAYGKYRSVPYDAGCHPAGPYPQSVIDSRSYRKHAYNMFNHPLTFKAWLFRRLTREDLSDVHGNYFVTGYDRAIMLPMLEMATNENHLHWRCLDDVTYDYNSINMNSEAPQKMDTSDSDIIVTRLPRKAEWR